MIVSPFKTICIFLLLPIPFIAFSQEAETPEENDILELEEISVTGLRVEKRLKDTPVITEVIDAEEIAQSGATDLSGVLEDYGIMCTSNSMGDYISLQGLGESRVLFLIDGRRVPGKVSQRIKGQTIPIGDIERIEIVRGAQSALYGSDGMGGVINIITKPTAENFALSARFTNSLIPAYNTEATEESQNSLKDAQPLLEQNLRINLTYGLGKTSNKLSIDGTRGEMYMNDTGSTSITPQQWRGKISNETSFTMGDTMDMAIGGSIMLMVEEDQTSAQGSLLTEETNRYEAYAEYDWLLTDTISISSRLYDHFYQRERQEYSGLTEVWDDPDYENENLLTADSYATIDLTDGLLLVSGGEFSLNTMNREWLTLDDAEKDISRIRGALMVQAEWYDENSYSLVAGIRGEGDSRYGLMAAPRLAGMYYLTPELRLLSGAGLGYRAPDFNELYVYRNVGTMPVLISGNPDLKPEYSLGGNIGAEYAAERFFLQTNIYYTELFQEIVYDETGETDIASGKEIYRTENLDRSMRAGLDLEGKIHFANGLFISAGYNYLFAYNRSETEELREEPGHTARVKTGLEIQSPALTIDISTNYMSPQDPDDSSENYREHRYQIDLYSSWGINENYLLFLSLKNITGYINESLGPYYGQKLTLGMEASF